MKPRTHWPAIRAVLLKPVRIPLPPLRKPNQTIAKRNARISLAIVMLLFGAFAVWRISLEYRINSRLKAIASRGEPVTTAALNRMYPAPPAEENAALIWLQGFEQLRPQFRLGYEPWSRLTLPEREPAPPTMDWLEAAEGFLNSNRVALATFHHAASMEKSRFPVELNKALLDDTDHLERLRSAAGLLHIEAFVAAETRDIEGAIASIRALLAAGKSVRNQAGFMSLFTRTGIDRRAFLCAERLLNCAALTDGQLQELSSAFGQSEDADGLWRALVGERLRLLLTLGTPRTVLTNAESAEQSTEFENFVGGAFVKLTGIFDRELPFMIDAFERILPLSQRSDPDRFLGRREIDKIKARAEAGYYIISGVFLPSERSFDRDCEHRARLRIAEAAFAIERFLQAHRGELPSTLPIGMDPFDGQPLRVRPTPAGYVVYSVGPDGTDDGRAPPVKSRGKAQPAPADITFFVERR